MATEDATDTISSRLHTVPSLNLAGQSTNLAMCSHYRSKDDRVQVQPMISPPYKWICFLTIKSITGKHCTGTGFKVLLPNVDRTAVITSANCIFIDGAYAKVVVHFPEQIAIEIQCDDLYVPQKYKDNSDPAHNYGLILLPGPGDGNDGFGWSSTEELDLCLVNNCGYPDDKTYGTMWITGGKIANHNDDSFFYMDNSIDCKSGSPVFIWAKGNWCVLGIQSGQKDSLSCAVCFTKQMIFDLLQSMLSLKPKVIRSVPFPNAYISCDGSGLSSRIGSGGGTINCQHAPPSANEKFYIYPVEMIRVGVPYKVVIRSAQWPNIFVRMDGSDMTKFNSSGGGIVNCQYGAFAYETFFFEKWCDDMITFRSYTFPHCYIRLDGTEVKSRQGSGSGTCTVNCQYYDDITSPPKDWEKFSVEEYN